MANSLQIDTNNVVAGLGTFSYTIPGIDGVEESTDITTVADVAGSLNSTFFNVYSALNAVAYYVWYNINSAGVDPAIVGKTGVMVAAATGATANTIATATRAALTAIPAFVITGATNHVIITNADSGATTNATDGTAATGFSISITAQGVTANPANVFLSVNVQSTLPYTSGSYNYSQDTQPVDSALAIAIQLNGVNQVSTGGATANPTPSQPSLGAGCRLQCEAGDVVSVVLSSAAAIDNQPNSIKSSINLYLGV